MAEDRNNSVTRAQMGLLGGWCEDGEMGESSARGRWRAKHHEQRLQGEDGVDERQG